MTRFYNKSIQIDFFPFSNILSQKLGVKSREKTLLSNVVSINSPPPSPLLPTGLEFNATTEFCCFKDILVSGIIMTTCVWQNGGAHYTEACYLL